MYMNRFIKDYIKQEPGGFCCFITLLLIIIPAVFAPYCAPYDPYATDLSGSFASPSFAHPFGTDELNRDILSRIIFGTRTSLLMGFGPTSINLMVGTLIGMYSALSNKIIDGIVMRIADVILSFPFMVLAMAIVYNLGASLFHLFLTLILVGWATIARVVRAETIALKETMYIEAAKAMGAGTFTIMIRHILPNIVPTLLVLYTMSVPGAILSEAGLSFLGFGAQPPSTSLGVMIQKGKGYLFDAPWISLAPGFVLLIIAMSFNFLGDSLRHYFDVKTSR